MRVGFWLLASLFFISMSALGADRAAINCLRDQLPGMITGDFVLPEEALQPVQVMSYGKTKGMIRASRVLPNEKGSFLEREAARIQKENNGVIIAGEEICFSEGCTGMYSDYRVKIPGERKISEYPTVLLKRPLDKYQRFSYAVYLHENMHMFFGNAGKNGKGFSFSIWLENTGRNTKRHFYHKGLSLEENYNYSWDIRRALPEYGAADLERAFAANPRGIPRGKLFGNFRLFRMDVKRYWENVNRVTEELPLALKALKGWRKEVPTAKEFLFEIAYMKKGSEGTLIERLDDFVTIPIDEAGKRTISMPLNTAREREIIRQMALFRNDQSKYLKLRDEIIEIWRVKISEQLHYAKRLRPQVDEMWADVLRWQNRKFIRKDEYDRFIDRLDRVEEAANLSDFEHPEWWIPGEGSSSLSTSN